MKFVALALTLGVLGYLGVSTPSPGQRGSYSFLRLEETAFAVDHYACQQAYWAAYAKCRNAGNSIQTCYGVAGEASDACYAAQGGR